MTIDLAALPHLRWLFDHLRKGRHLCADDGPPYVAMRADYPSHHALFAALGLDLVEHERGFYYLRSEADLGKEATELAVFFFVLVEAWSDEGRDLESTVFAPGGHAVADLPHFARESSTRCMQEAGVAGPEELSNVVGRLVRYGFAAEVSDGMFRFRTPAWRFLDLCREVADEADAAESKPQ